MPAAEGTTEDNRWTKWLNESGPSNVKFVPIPRWESAQKLNVLFASGSAPDLIFEYNPVIMDTFYTQKQLMPLDDLIEKHSTVYKNLLEQYPALRKVGTKSDGKLYSVARLASVQPIHGLLIRKDWLDKLGLEVPTTVEELLTVAKAFTEQDPDGNNADDTYGISLSFKSQDVIQSFFNAYGINPAIPLVVENGELVISWENQKLAVDYMKQIFEMGAADKDFLNDANGAKAKQDFLNGKLGIYPNQVGTYFDFAVNSLSVLKKNDPAAEVIPIAYPASSKGSYNPAFTNPVQVTAYVNANAKNPDAVMKYIDFASEVSTGRKLGYGDDGTHHVIGENGCPVVTDADKFKNEVAYNGDLQMLVSGLLDVECGDPELKFNVNDPIQKEGLEMHRMAKEAYLDVNKPYPGITHPEHYPMLPEDLSLIMTGAIEAIQPIWYKSVLGGSSYTTDQAMQDAIMAWEKSGGKKVEDWYQDWYINSKDTAFLAKDIYDMIETK